MCLGNSPALTSTRWGTIKMHFNSLGFCHILGSLRLEEAQIYQDMYKNSHKSYQQN